MSLDGGCPTSPPQPRAPGPRGVALLDHRTTMPVGAVPAGRAVGQVGSSVTSPPLTAELLTTGPRPPVAFVEDASGLWRGALDPDLAGYRPGTPPPPVRPGRARPRARASPAAESPRLPRRRPPAAGQNPVVACRTRPPPAPGR